MDTNNQYVHSLLLSMEGFQVIVPQASVCEIIDWPTLRPLSGSADWLTGFFDWRTEKVPLLSFEQLCGLERSVSSKKSHVAVLYTLDEIESFPYFSFQLNSIPRPITMHANMLVESEFTDMESDIIASTVQMENQKVVIPALNIIEQNLLAQIKKAESQTL